MLGIRLCCVTACLLFSSAWAAPQGSSNKIDDHHQHLHHGNDQPHPHHDPEDNVLYTHNADFAFKLYSKLNALNDSQGKNIFFSPLSISMALSMLALGAKGDTHTQLYEALGFSDLTAEKVNEGFEHIVHMLRHNQGNMQLDTSSAVAVRNDFKVLDKFLEDTKHYFESETFSTDFSKPDVAAEEINRFIAQKTNNTITDMVKDLDPNTVMMLINCIYFRGEWEDHFDKDETQKVDFHVDENTKLSVDMMHREDYYDFYEDKENFTTVIRLPYKGSTSMIVVLPDVGKMKEVESTISKDHMRHWRGAMNTRSLKIGLPRFSTSSSYSLEEGLKELGVVNAFGEKADFSRMTESKVKVSKVQHKAVLNVDEKGTEAAATTTVAIELDSLPPPPKIVTIDRPFLVFIAERTTRSILFMGKILDPTAK
uniref:Serpin domain-containing protein n=3 Tax=Denticeps clupeoides TaxID=299321 RepID=A0AAY4D1L3_9TELE